MSRDERLHDEVCIQVDVCIQRKKDIYSKVIAVEIRREELYTCTYQQATDRAIDLMDEISCLLRERMTSAIQIELEDMNLLPAAHVELTCTDEEEGEDDGPTNPNDPS